MSFRLSFVAALFLQLWFGAALAQPELEACRSSGLVALKEHNPSISDVALDMDSMTVAKATPKVEDIPIRTIVIGDAYLEHGKKTRAELSSGEFCRQLGRQKADPFIKRRLLDLAQDYERRIAIAARVKEEQKRERYSLTLR
ncbi:hypothetical protein [Bradyrhizobium sp. USDA 10063]